MAVLIAEKSRETDLPALRRLYDGCSRTIAALGIDQWQDGYPQTEVIAADIAQGRGFVFRESGKVIAAFAAFPEGDPFYLSLGEDFWCDWRPHFAIHRVAVDPTLRQRGIGRGILDSCAAMAREAGCATLRIDTHAGNIPMRTMLEHYGFRYVGDMILPGGLPRVGYQYEL